MTKLHILGVSALVLVLLAPDALAQRGRGGAVSSGVRGRHVRMPPRSSVSEVTSTPPIRTLTDAGSSCWAGSVKATATKRSAPGTRSLRQTSGRSCASTSTTSAT